MKYVKSLKSFVVVVLFAVLLTSCQGQSGVSIQFGNYVASNFLMEWLVPTAHATVNQVNFCFKRLRFKADDVDSADPQTDGDNIDLEVGLLPISTSGTAITNIIVPEGVYRRVEFDLEDNCDTGYSAQIQNTSGDYETASRVTIKFSGQFTADGSSQALSLGIDEIVGQIDAFSGAGSLKDALEAASGEF